LIPLAEDSEFQQQWMEVKLSTCCISSRTNGPALPSLTLLPWANFTDRTIAKYAREIRDIKPEKISSYSRRDLR
jgi:hypothetical protein